VPIALIARKDLPVKDFKEFIAYARRNHRDAVRFRRRGLGDPSGCVLLNY